MDESDYALILQQVKTAEFNEELEQRLKENRKEEQTRLDLALSKQKSEMAAQIESKNREIAKLEADISNKDNEKRRRFWRGRWRTKRRERRMMRKSARC